MAKTNKQTNKKKNNKKTNKQTNNPPKKRISVGNMSYLKSFIQRIIQKGSLAQSTKQINVDANITIEIKLLKNELTFMCIVQTCQNENKLLLVRYVKK